MKLWPFGKREVKESAAGVVASKFIAGQVVWTPREYDKMAREAYVRNAIAARCIKLIASNAALAKVKLFGPDGEAIDDHPLLDLLRRPNPMSGGGAFMEAFYSYLMISGNSYIEAIRPNASEPPAELWMLRPDRMKVRAGAHGMPASYIYSAGGHKKEWPVDPVTGQSLILHVREFHPTDDWYGMGRVEPAAYGIDRHNAASAHNKSLLDNGARPSGALVFEPVKSGDGVQMPPGEVIDEALNMLDEHTGVSKAGKPFVFGGSVKWLEMGISPKDMDFGDGKDDAARDICIAFGVPHILIVQGAATYNNVSEAKLELWEQTILPLLDRVMDELNNWLTPMFGEGLRLKVDEDSISALGPRRERKRAGIIELLNAGVITADEARQALQYGAVGDSSVKKVDAAVLSALIAGVDKMGYEPLLNYAKSVGLVGQDVTEDQLLESVTAYLGATL